MKSTNYFNKIFKKKINKLRSILLIKTSNELSSKNKRNSMKINGKSISDLNNNYNNLEINIKNPLEKGDSNRYGNYSTNILHINFNDSILYENLNFFVDNKKLNSNEIEFLRTRTKSIISKNNLKENNKKNNEKNNENIIKISKNKEKESLFYLRNLANLFKNYKFDSKKLNFKRENFKKNKSSNNFRKNNNNNNLKVLINNLFNENNNENLNEEKINSNSFINNFDYDYNENNIKHSSTIKNEILKRIFIKEKILNFNEKIY